MFHLWTYLPRVRYLTSLHPREFNKRVSKAEKCCGVSGAKGAKVNTHARTLSLAPLPTTAAATTTTLLLLLHYHYYHHFI